MRGCTLFLGSFACLRATLICFLLLSVAAIRPSPLLCPSASSSFFLPFGPLCATLCTCVLLLSFGSSSHWLSLPLLCLCLPPYLYPSASLFQATASGRLLSLHLPYGVSRLFRGWVGVILYLLGSPVPPFLFAASASADSALVPVAACFHIALRPSSLPGFAL